MGWIHSEVKLMECADAASHSRAGGGGYTKLERAIWATLDMRSRDVVVGPSGVLIQRWGEGLRHKNNLCGG